MNRNIKSLDAIIATTQILKMPKYEVIDHKTMTLDNLLEGKPPHGATDVMVIYLKDTM